MRPKGRQMMAWLLTAAVTLSGNSFTVLADEMDFSDVQMMTEETDTAEAQNLQDNANLTEDAGFAVDEEIEASEEAGIQEAEEFEVSEEAQIQELEDTEISIEEDEETGIDIQEEELFSAGEEENNPEEYRVWFENLRENDGYNTYLFENEEGTLKLNTKNLEDKNASVEWKVGYRRDDQDDSRTDDFTTNMGIPDEMIFWSENADDNSVLEINGAKLWKAQNWLQQQKGNEYWFEVRAEVKVEGEDEPVYIEQAGIHGRELVEEYHLPGDETLLVDWDHWVDSYVDCWVENPEYPGGDNLTLKVTEISVNNVEGEEDETPVCEVNYSDENGWNIHANRFGVSEVTLTYSDIHGEEQHHSFSLFVNGDKYTLEAQWTSSESNMLKNSEMKLPFILRHEWKYSGENWGEEEVNDWKLEFAPNDDGWYYDTNLLKSVQVNEHELTVRSKEETWGNEILLKATIPSENEGQEDVAYFNVWINVRNEYDVLYPETLKNLNLGETLDLNQCGLKVKHIKEDGTSFDSENFYYDVEFNSNQWKNEAEEGQLPILRRTTLDETQVNVIVRENETDGELTRREYHFNGLDYSVWFEDMRQDEYSTYFFDNEKGELRLNTENLEDKNATISWAVGYRTVEDEEGHYEFISEMGLPQDLHFWSEKADDSSRLEINGEKLWSACDWLLKNKGENYWFEVCAAINAGDEIVESRCAGISAKEHVEQYYLNFEATLQVVPQEDIWLDNTLEWYVEDKDHPWGDSLYTDVTKVKVLDKAICDVAYLGTGWRIKGIQPGETTLEVTYKDLLGKVKTGTFPLCVEDSIYYMDYEDVDGNRIYPNVDNKINITVYNRKEGNAQDEEINVSDYILTVQKDSYDPDVIRNIKIQDNHQVVLNVGDIREGEVSFALQAVSVAKDTEGNPLWSAETWFYYEITRADQIKLNVSYIRESPGEQEEFDIGKYEPTLLRYDGENNCWVEIKNGDDENIRLRLDYDEAEWKAKDDSLLPVLVRQTDQRVGFSIIAEEREIDRFGIEHWNYLADYSYGFRTIYDAKEECRHKTNGLQTVKAATCVAEGLKREVCECCGKIIKEEKIPATGRHPMSAWKTTKAATALGTGLKERRCTVCGKKQQQTIPKLKATGRLNVPSKLPLKVKQSYQLKVTGLAKGDRVVSWTSSNAKVATVVKGNGKVTGKKAGSAVITVNLKSGHKIKVTVKVQKTDVVTTSLTVTNKATGKKIPKTVSLKVKKKLTLAATVAPLTSKQKVTYSSSNKKIATVSSNGVITAKKNGTVTITVKSGKKTVKVKVKVTK